MADDGKISWKPGMSYCGTYREAVNYALDDNSFNSYQEQILFLENWREGDLSDWPEFKFEPQPKETTQ